MFCKKCSYPRSEIVSVKHDDIKNVTLRRRECTRCGARFNTVENHRESANDYITDKDYFREIGK